MEGFDVMKQKQIVIFTTTFFLLIGAVLAVSSPILPDVICWDFYGGGSFCLGNASTIYGENVIINESLYIKENLRGPDMSMGWGNLTAYPSACPSGTSLTTIDDSITCTSFVQNETPVNFTFANVTGDLVVGGNLSDGTNNVTVAQLYHAFNYTINDTFIQNNTDISVTNITLASGACMIWVEGGDIC